MPVAPVTSASAPTAGTAGTVGGPDGSIDSGVDKSAMDPSISPCDDFYQYACGGWIRATNIPADEPTWYRSFSVIRERNEEILKRILEGYAKGESLNEPYAKPLGDFYGSCMDEGAIEQAETKPLEPFLKSIDAISDSASLTRWLGQSQAHGMPMVFELMSAQDFRDASQVVAMIWQGGLGMPEREYYLDATPKMAELRAQYEVHVANMMKLLGEHESKAKASAKVVLKLETMLARAWMSKEDRRNPKKINHRATRGDLGKTAPGFAWPAWLEGAGAADVATFNVAQPDFIREVGAMIHGKVTLADWKVYLRWHLVRDAADQLSARFVDEKFAWKRILVGTQSLPPRWKRCVRAIDGAMGEALARPFVRQTLGSEGKATVVGMVQAIENAMHKNLETTTWMDEPTRKSAFVKLDKIANKIAYPDTWRNYDALSILRGDYLGNAMRSSAFEYRRQLSKIGKPVDRSEWQMSPPTVNAYYDAQLNEMVFPAGILQPPFYSNASSMSANYGGIGMVMGHELTHGFDDEGRQFDADGNLKDWWSAGVGAEFDRRAKCVEDQFNGYTVLGDVHVNGKLTLGENIADLGGVKLSYHAMLSQARKGSAGQAAGKSEFSPEQQFFLGFAQGWCGKLRDEALRHLVATNPHSPPTYRVNGPLSNSPWFAQAFSCQAGKPMVRKNRCEVW
ncbi:MAG: M13 family metallopeptidase [Polyangiaceae bacterium]|nr:M13 family metallopeptidase [Polyangiaceae bacterium]